MHFYYSDALDGHRKHPQWQALDKLGAIDWVGHGFVDEQFEVGHVEDGNVVGAVNGMVVME
jgi:hypothetical protein